MQYAVVNCQLSIGAPGTAFAHNFSMEKKKKPDLNDQVHSEFETSIGNDFNVVREELAKKKKENDKDAPLNQLPDEDSVKNDQSAGEEPPKMDTPEES